MAVKEKLYKDLLRPKLNRAQISSIYKHLQTLDPAPRTELNYSNPYTLVVAVALSAQSTDVGVNKATKALFEKADTPEKMVTLGEDTVRDHIKTIGLYKNKAANVIKLSQMLIDDYGAVVPEDRDELIKLPGVGRKTANVVMNEAFGHPTMAVDTHIFRVANRTGMAPGKNVYDVDLICYVSQQMNTFSMPITGLFSMADILASPVNLNAIIARLRTFVSLDPKLKGLKIRLDMNCLVLCAKDSFIHTG